MHFLNLKVFCDLVETGSFSVAADRNGITQSAVSQQIKTLEQRFGVVFFERGKKNFSITPEGTVFHAAAVRMLEIYRNIDAELHSVRNEVGGPLRVATVYSLGLHELPPLLKDYRARFPQVDLTVSYRRNHTVYDEVLNDHADLGVVAYPRPRRGLVVEIFAQDRMVLISAPGHPLARRESLRVKDLHGQSFISFEPDLPTRKAVDQLLREHEVDVEQAMELDNIETVKRAVEVESGVALVPSNSVAEEAATGQLRAMHLEDAEMWRPMGTVLRRGRTITPALREFVNALRQLGSPAKE
jgi:LysR family transcriptional regulator, transcriptional activator of the cysJI operon